MPYAIVRARAPKRSPEHKITYAVPLTDSRVGDSLYEVLGVGDFNEGRVRLADGRVYQVYGDGSATEVE